MGIPVVDFSDILSGFTDLTTCPQVKELHSAFSTVGFVFLKNHGIDNQLIDKSFKSIDKFFGQSDVLKHSFLRDGFGPDGYTCIDSTTSPQPGDLKEYYDICDSNHENVPEVYESVKTELYCACSTLSMRILQALGCALELKDCDFFVQTHNKMGQGFLENYSMIRLLSYPPVMTAGRERCAEHLDYGTLSLIFQDSNGGLQVKCPDSHYIDVQYTADCVLVITGRTMGTWTNNTYKPTFHRVPTPLNEQLQQLPRKSIAFFVHPNSDVCIEPLTTGVGTTHTNVQGYCTLL